MSEKETQNTTKEEASKDEEKRITNKGADDNEKTLATKDSSATSSKPKGVITEEFKNVKESLSFVWSFERIILSLLFELAKIMSIP